MTAAREALEIQPRIRQGVARPKWEVVPQRAKVVEASIRIASASAPSAADVLSFISARFLALNKSAVRTALIFSERQIREVPLFQSVPLALDLP